MYIQRRNGKLVKYGFGTYIFRSWGSNDQVCRCHTSPRYSFPCSCTARLRYHTFLCCYSNPKYNLFTKLGRGEERRIEEREKGKRRGETGHTLFAVRSVERISTYIGSQVSVKLKRKSLLSIEMKREDSDWIPIAAVPLMGANTQTRSIIVAPSITVTGNQRITICIKELASI